ncbi:MAG: hypothetical protein FWG50_11195 [Kiritimatiellaeota bacterium]|nr:hypothetical protein [Kiritimatiellota bacterium]
MKQVLITVCGIALTVFNAHSEVKPKADVYLRVTDELPKWSGREDGYNGIFSVTNTGEVAFTIITDEDWSAETTWFYQDGNEEELGREKQWKKQGREYALADYRFCIKNNEANKTLQSGESVSFKCKKFFILPTLGEPGGFFKAEMYLGDDTWVPVHITPTLGTLLAIRHDSREPAGAFYYSQEGTNQYLYAKEGEKFKRVAEMKLKSTPLKESKEDTVTFVSPDGKTKKLTREQAAEIIREREQQNQ